MKKLFPILVVLVLTVGIAGVAFASAADMKVQGGTIQAGADYDVKMYDIAEVNGWLLETDTGLVSGVRLNFEAAVDDFGGNNELSYFVIITNAAHEEIARSRVDKTFPIQPHTNYNLTNELFTFNTPVAAVDIWDIHIYVEGSANSGPTGPQAP